MFQQDRFMGYYLIEEGSKVYEAAQDFREKTLAYRKDVIKYFKLYGVSNFRLNFDGKPFTFQFEEGRWPSQGFKKKDRNGFSAPYVKNEEWKHIIANAPVEPQADNFIHPVVEIPQVIEYEYEGGSGWCRLGTFSLSKYNLGWYHPKGPIVLVMCDVKKELEDFAKRKEDFKLKNPEIQEWKVPEGLTQILKEEWDLMVAKHKQKEGQ